MVWIQPKKSRCIQIRPCQLWFERNSLLINEENFLKDPYIEKIKDSELYVYIGEQISSHPYYVKGYMSAQDPGSYQIARTLDVKCEEKVLDVCSAPGTKVYGHWRN